MKLFDSMAAAVGALALCGASVAAYGADVYVVAAAGVSLSAEEVREVFLGDKQFSASVKLAPVDNVAVQADFLSRVVRVDAAKYASIWSKKGFREGLTPPPVKGGDAEVLAALRANPGTVGYVSKPPADMKVLHKF